MALFVFISVRHILQQQQQKKFQLGFWLEVRKLNLGKMRPLATLAWRRTCVSGFGKWNLSVPQNNRSCHSISSQPESANILRSKFDDVPLSKLPYFDFLWMNHKKNGERTALVTIVLLLGSFINDVTQIWAFPTTTTPVMQTWANRGCDLFGRIKTNNFFSVS